MYYNLFKKSIKIRDFRKDDFWLSLKKFELKQKQIVRFVSIKKEKDVIGLIELGREMNIPIEYIGREELATITAPNPSETVQAFEGTASVSEAAAIKSSNTFCFFNCVPASCHFFPYSPPPRKLGTA